MSRDLQVVLKVAERCNINCSYCYYLNSGNDAPSKRPAYMSEDVARGVVRFVQESGRLIDLGQVRVVLHGGEPLMLKKPRFRSICKILSDLDLSKSRGSLVITTNAMLIDEEWISIFEEFDIGVSVSMDGPKSDHDRERVDFNGHGTYERVAAGVKRLQRAASDGRISPPGVLTVIDPRSRGDIVYNHLVRELGFKCADFLVPMTLHDSHPSSREIEAVGNFLVQAFTEWAADDDPSIQIRIFDKYLRRLLGRSDQSDANPDHIVVGVGSDGTIVNDDLMQILGTQIFPHELNVCTNNITEYLSAVTTGVLGGVYVPHKECVECSWYHICRPRTIPWEGAEMRYSRSRGFQNKLVHCDAYQMLFSQMSSYLEGYGTLIPKSTSDSHARTASLGTLPTPGN